MTTTVIPTWTMADRMRKARISAGLSQADICERIGISRKSVTNYEQGDTTPLRAILNAWSEVTGVPVEWMVDGTVTHEYQAARSLYALAA